MTQVIGVLLTNTGTPDAPTPKALYRYLRQFLSDPRVVQAPKWLWWFLLYGIILPTRSFYSAKLYKKIWTTEGSPLRLGMEQLAEAVQELGQGQFDVVVGMHYGQPSIPDALEKLRTKGIERVLVFPLYPQFSQTTTASTFDSVSDQFKKWPALPEIRMIREYATDPAYIEALCQHITQFWQENGQSQHLLFSFHGLPKLYAERGDPYAHYCEATVAAVTKKLNLPSGRWSFSFQSRTGYAEWLKPYTQDVLKNLPLQGIDEVDVICPGFAIDCLETLEEVAMRAKNDFMEVGGKRFHYIPALNNTTYHVKALTEIIKQHSQGWI